MIMCRVSAFLGRKKADVDAGMADNWGIAVLTGSKPKRCE